MNNYFEIKVKAISENEAFVRNLVASFSVALNPTIDDITDIKTAVSEAVTNCIVHAYDNCNDDYITITGSIKGTMLEIIIKDNGVGIENVEEATKPFFTTKADEERSGMGFTLMETFMDEMDVSSVVGEGTTVRLVKNFNSSSEDLDA